MSTLVQDDVNNLQHAWLHKPYASNIIHPFGADEFFFQYLAGIKLLTRSGTRHFFLEAYCFSCWVVKSLRFVLLNQVSPI
jgi:hypothetical protein